MSRNRSRALLAIVFASIAVCSPALPSVAAEDELARVRAHGTLHCAGIVRPGLAVPGIDGTHWYGLAADVCRAVAAAVLGDPARMTFRPYFEDERTRPPSGDADDIVFVSGAQLVGDAAASATALQLGPAIVHDGLALLAPAGGVSHVAELATKTICVEPGSPADRALQRYFESHALALHEHPFQETDEMRQAYGDGKCDALAGPLSTLASVRADPAEGRTADRVLPEFLADDPIVAATAGDARWSRVVWWVFSVLVDAEDAGISAHASVASTAIPGVPPALATELGLKANWAHAALAAGGNYGELFERDFGASSKFGLARGTNALWRNGGLIFGLSVE